MTKKFLKIAAFAILINNIPHTHGSTTENAVKIGVVLLAAGGIYKVHQYYSSHATPPVAHASDAFPTQEMYEQALEKVKAKPALEEQKNQLHQKDRECLKIFVHYRSIFQELVAKRCYSEDKKNLLEERQHQVCRPITSYLYEYREGNFKGLKDAACQAWQNHKECSKITSQLNNEIENFENITNVMKDVLNERDNKCISLLENTVPELSASLRLEEDIKYSTIEKLFTSKIATIDEQLAELTPHEEIIAAYTKNQSGN